MKLEFRPGLSGEQLVAVINAFEGKLEAKLPAVKWSFIEPDVRTEHPVLPPREIGLSFVPGPTLGPACYA